MIPTPQVRDCFETISAHRASYVRHSTVRSLSESIQIKWMRPAAWPETVASADGFQVPREDGL
jgi:hypothetical protein